MFVSTAWAMAQAPQDAQGGGGGFGPIIMMAAIFAIFYFLLIRPQQKRAKEHKAMMDALKKGDKVITSGGIYGLVESVGQHTVTLKIAENVKVKFGKSYIGVVRTEGAEEE